MAQAQPYQLLPPLSAAAFRELKDDIARRGVLVPIERDENGVLLDGHHRMRAVEELAKEGGVMLDPPVILRLDFSEAQKRSHVRALNIHRRMLTAAQRRALIEDELREGAERSDRAIAKALSVSPSTVGMVRRKLGEKDPTVQNGQSKRVGVDGRRRALPPPRSVMAASGLEAKRALAAMQVLPPGVLPERVLSTHDAVTAARLVKEEASRETRMDRLRDPGPLDALGEKRYAIIYLDPPWHYNNAADPTRSAERHYPTMTHEQLLLLPVAQLAADDAVMFMWCTPPKVAEGIALMAAYGFEYKTCACWDKGGVNGTRPGMGSYYRQQHELLFVGTRGNTPPPAAANRPLSILRQSPGPHSAKPELARKQIEAMFAGDMQRLELFARGDADDLPGWDCWGMESHSSLGARREA